MNPRGGRSLLPTAVVCLLLAGLFTPMAVLGQEGSSQSQLGVLISAAESSRSYANETVALAAAHGLSVGAAQARLSEGDSLLATAEAEAASGTSLTEGIAAAQAAMSDYVSASTLASVSLTNAGLTGGVDLHATLAAVAAANETLSVVASAAAQACDSGAVNSSDSAFVQACASVNAQISEARTHLSQADSILVQAEGETNAGVNLSQALALVAQARADVNASAAALLTASSFAYTQRAGEYFAAVIQPLSAEANATIKSEELALGNLSEFQSSFSTYATSQASASAEATAASSTLSAAIAQVNSDSSSTSSSIAAAQSTEVQLYSDLQALLAIPTIMLNATIVNDIKACMSAAASYGGALSSLQAQLNGFSQTALSAYQGYYATVGTDASSVQSSGQAYVSTYGTVVNDLSPFESLPEVQAVLGLQVSGTVTAANTSVQQETSAMATVGTGVISFLSAVSAAQSSVPVSSALVSTAESVYAQGSVYLNATAKAALSDVSSSLQSTAQAAATFVTATNECVDSTIGTFADSAVSLSMANGSLKAQTHTSEVATAAAVAYVTSATEARVSEAASGLAEASYALQLFSAQNVAGGAAAMAQAQAYLQAASSVSAY